jgi:hypothetical protein
MDLYGLIAAWDIEGPIPSKHGAAFLRIYFFGASISGRVAVVLTSAKHIHASAVHGIQFQIKLVAISLGAGCYRRFPACAVITAIQPVLAVLQLSWGLCSFALERTLE